MKFRCVVEYEYPAEHKTPVKAELILHGDRVETWNVKPLEQEPRAGWIPVNERLPECNVKDTWHKDISYSEDIILSFEDGDIAFGIYRNDGNWYLKGNDEEPVHSINAWMPLPQPYQEGADE